LIVVAAGCSNTSVPTSRALGVITTGDSANGTGLYFTSPTAVFWDAVNISLPGSNAPANSCIDTLYFPPDTSHTVIPNQLDAGASIGFTSSVSVGTLIPDTIPGVVIAYHYHGPGFQYVPGGDITFVVPGAAGGFDASTIVAHTAKKLVGVAVPAQPVPTDSMQLTWVQGTPGADAVNIYMIYEDSTSNVPDRQIICSMDDNGSMYVPIKMTKHWHDAYPYYQAVHAFRFVTSYQTTSSGGLLYTYSRFDTTAVPYLVP
jgi:hypothetical protein